MRHNRLQVHILGKVTQLVNSYRKNRQIQLLGIAAHFLKACEPHQFFMREKPTVAEQATCWLAQSQVVVPVFGEIFERVATNQGDTNSLMKRMHASSPSYFITVPFPFIGGECTHVISWCY